MRISWKRSAGAWPAPSCKLTALGELVLKFKIQRGQSTFLKELSGLRHTYLEHSRLLSVSQLVSHKGEGCQVIFKNNFDYYILSESNVIFKIYHIS